MLSSSRKVVLLSLSTSFYQILTGKVTHNTYNMTYVAGEPKNGAFNEVLFFLSFFFFFFDIIQIY